jgi:hypothetical protein
MKRYLFAMLVVMATALQAAEISQQQAMEKARAFMQNHQTAGGAMHRAPLHIDMQGTKTDHQLLYAFNVEGGGFVIVSGDDRTVPVLGYSDTGQLEPDNMPDNMRAWLEGYAAEIARLGTRAPQDAQNVTRRHVGSHSTAEIAPLLKTAWYQGNPYNMLCPDFYFGELPAKSATGCVATAMAQVMKYHEWPKAATAAIPGYIAKKNNIDLTAGLPPTTFDWANMLDSYPEEGAAEAQNLAVATLMVYCGYSVEMNYGDSSGAETYKVANALKSFFDYNSTTRSVSRSYYSSDKWADLIYHELANQRPVVYAGTSPSAGHAFVCDGYQYESNTDLFHINWGWNGRDNGYFVLSALDSDHPGVEGATSTEGYFYGQEAIIGVQPSTGTGTTADIEPNVVDLKVNSVKLESNNIPSGIQIDVILNVTNNSTDDYDGDLYFGIMTGTESMLYSGNHFHIPAGETRDCGIPYKPLVSGTYDIVLYTPNPDGSFSTDDKVVATLTVIDGNVNTDIPLSGYDLADGWCSQFVTPAADLDFLQNKYINGITFYASMKTSGWGNAKFDVYLGEIGETTLSELKDWDSLTKVYAGSLSVNNRKMVITFDNSYQYKGGNLLVGMTETELGDESPMYWYGTIVQGAAVCKGYNVHTVSFRPHTVFDYSEAPLPTAIHSLENGKMETENGVFYNLAGQRITRPSKGLYIQNGKKFVVE